VGDVLTERIRPREGHDAATRGECQMSPNYFLGPRSFGRAGRLRIGKE
jgi:hypothetical protein